MPSAIIVPRTVQNFIESRLRELVFTSLFYPRLSLPVSCVRAIICLLCSPRCAQTLNVPDAAAVPAAVLTLREFGEVLSLLLASVGSRWTKTVYFPIRKAICFPTRLMITVRLPRLLLCLSG